MHESSLKDAESHWIERNEAAANRHTFLMSSSRAAATVSGCSVSLTYQRTNSYHFSSPARRSCSLHRSGPRCVAAVLCTFLCSVCFHRRTRRLSTSRPGGAAPKNDVETFAFCHRRRVQHGIPHSSPKFRRHVRHSA